MTTPRLTRTTNPMTPDHPPAAKELPAPSAPPPSRRVGLPAWWVIAGWIFATPVLATAPLADGAVPATGTALPATVQSVFTDAGIPAGAIAVVVEKLDPPAAGQRVVSVNAEQAMNPASVMKLFTTAAALDLLGPAHTWQTELLARRPAIKGQLRSPLYLKGSGDPQLNLEQFWDLLRQLRLNGVREIQGNLVIDRHLFALPHHDPSAFDGQALRPYNVGADAALVNFNAIRLRLLPNPDKNRVDVRLETPDARLRIRNRLTLANGDCGDWRERIDVTVDGTMLKIAGRLARTCGEKMLGLAPLSANQQIDGLFRALWQELGGTWRGKVEDGAVPENAIALARHESPPLADVIRAINKHSNNVMARQVFLALSVGTPPASYEKSRARLHQWLAGKSIAAPELVIDNGAGLSRNDRVSADSLAALLKLLWKQPSMPDFVASLPVLGEDGTLKKRGRDLPASKGRAHLKTGYIDGVRALAGYILDRNGERWLLVAMINHPEAIRGKEGMDRLVDWVVNRNPDNNVEARSARTILSAAATGDFDMLAAQNPNPD